ncbi:MAG: hypothetical protein OEY85_10145 [Rhodospirillales bacterium]|nr:hypothetical protein [Rhodospirillales bacterium]
MTALKPISALLTLLVAFHLATPAAADTQAGPFASFGPAGYSRDWNGTEEKTIRIGRIVQNETLPLRRLLGLDRKFLGYRVETVTVRIHSRPDRHMARGALRLIADGAVADHKRAGFERDVRLVPWNGGVIGRDFRTLRLDVRGRVRVRSIRVTLSRPSHGRHGRGHVDNCRSMEQTIGRVMTNNNLDLIREFHLNRPRGCRIDRIIVRAHRTGGPGQVSLRVNGWPASYYQTVGGRSRELSFRPGHLPMVGRGLNRLDLQFAGRVVVDSVRLDFAPALSASPAAYSRN